ncbi:MAG TPA: hypothetical protein VFO01_11305 [Trebonia sp.]|nr:hypothetical protein [Trebonia sp.]
MNRSAVNHGTTSHCDLVEVSLSNLREHRADAARWLAVEVLLSDDAALEDDNLAARLHALQDRLEALTRVRYGVA